KTYEYRLRVRMANPNFDRKDAAAQGYAHEKDLTAKDWYVVPRKLAVPSDVNYYAVDQAKLDAQAPKEKEKDKEKDKEPKMPVQSVNKDTQTVLQLHKWVESLHTKTRSDLAVGDWVIAERVAATRGEPIGKQRVEVPYWRMTMDKFTMASDQAP